MASRDMNAHDPYAVLTDLVLTSHTPFGQIICQASDSEEEFLVADLDASRLEAVRRVWPFYRDRRPEAYTGLVDS